MNDPTFCTLKIYNNICQVITDKMDDFDGPYLSMCHDKKPSNIETQSNLMSLKSYNLAKFIAENMKAADLKWSLFCAACNSYRFDSVLKPFPPFFLLQDDNKQIERLRELIELCPSMPGILQQLKDNTLPATLIDLLYWALVNLSEPSFKYISKDEHQNILSEVSSEVPAATPDFIFSVTYGTRHQQKFALTTSNRPTKLAFHGSRLDNFYSIVNYGLQVSMNKVASFGPGIYLSSEMVVSLPYSPRGFTWNASLFGSHISVVALCEVIDHPDVKSENNSKKNIFGASNSSIPGKYLIVKNSDLVRIKYLLVYNSDEYNSISLAESPTLLGWIKRHKTATFILAYSILLLWIGSSNSNMIYKYYKKLLQRFQFIQR